MLAEVIIARASASNRVTATVRVPHGAEQRMSYPNRGDATRTLELMGLLPFDIQSMFDVMDANDPGTPVSFGLKELDEELLRQNGFDV